MRLLGLLLSVREIDASGVCIATTNRAVPRCPPNSSAVENAAPATEES
jgi:hypothetical protein